ncbi:TPA: murein L,D-transpeptidase catalytic domain family protein, partial [Stenotrophomonas maltophilia]|nr:murein L,D-transpeptidase catalytic domain family protein [Stenotrophomonas maltophilia]
MKKTVLLTSLALLPVSSGASVLTTNLDAPARRALEAIQCAGLTPRLLLIADMTKPKDSPRLRVLDLDTGKTILTDYVAHGVGSGSDVPQRFSNVEG